MHPRQCDSVNRMANLPQFHEWVSQRTKEDQSQSAGEAGEAGAGATPREAAPDYKETGDAEAAMAMASTGGRRNRVLPEPPAPSRGTSLTTLFQNSLDDWNAQIKDVPTDELLKDGSMCAAAWSLSLESIRIIGGKGEDRHRHRHRHRHRCQYWCPYLQLAGSRSSHS